MGTIPTDSSNVSLYRSSNALNMPIAGTEAQILNRPPRGILQNSLFLIELTRVTRTHYPQQDDSGSSDSAKTCRRPEDHIPLPHHLWLSSTWHERGRLQASHDADFSADDEWLAS